MKQLPIVAFAISTIFLTAPSHAESAILTVNISEARGLNSKAIDIKVWSGRATAVDFSEVNERITQIFLADPTHFTYATDTPLDNGQATTIFLRKIQPLKFPNLTTTNITNLFVKTKTTDGKAHLYTFNLLHSNSSPAYSGLSLSNQTPLPDGREPTLQVGTFRRATINDIERGLVCAIRKGYTPPSDPVVTKVREFIALARNTSDKSLVEVAQNTQVSLPLLTELGLLGIEDSLKRPLPKPTLNNKNLQGSE
ncbi:MAG: hypothetical protein HC836_39880 [Richelia sp. RM2_1_2]|nr:hypothetical protein [Richelia sp. SL_2_1]NJO64121.1 hypothetical protein [Richelia sp. RM2_1_2]